MSQDSFDLNAVDWSSVGLMRGAFLTADRDFEEERQRFLQYSTGRYGVVWMPENMVRAVPLQIANGGYKITLAACRAISPAGYPIEIIPDPSELLCEPCNVTALPQDNRLQIHVGVRRERAPVQVDPARQRAMKDIRFLQTRYRLSTTKREPDVLDWLCIGSFVFVHGVGLSEDTSYIPECLRLDSMERLKGSVRRIQRRAEGCLDQLKKQLDSRVTGAAAMAAAMTDATVALDTRSSPRAYIERLYSVLKIENELRRVIPHGGPQNCIENCLAKSLKEIPEQLRSREPNWGYIFYLIELALGALDPPPGHGLAACYRDWAAGVAGPIGDVIFDGVNQIQINPQNRLPGR